jgi:hypothetical protein
MHFKVMPTPKPRTSKQNAQEVQILIKTFTTAITIAAITATTTTTKKVKGKVKGRALTLKRWYKRFGHFNYADVKQLATYSSQIKLANNKELFCEPYTYNKQHAILNYEP